MYLSSRNSNAAKREPGDGDAAQSPELDGGEATSRDAASERTGAEGNVVALGVTSMFTDISAEMVVSVLPLYLTILYGFTPLQFGIFDGVYQGLAALVALAAAVVADRRRRLKEMAAAGYGMSAAATAGLVVAQGSWIGSVLFLYVDRLGKGIRTAPRDALISLSVVPARLARAFGLHRTLDTVGAVAGPVLASFVLARNANGYQTVFFVALCSSVIGLAALILFVDGRRALLAARPTTSSVDTSRERPRRLNRLRSDIESLLARPTYRLALILGAALALLSPGLGLLFLTFQRNTSLTTAQFPLLYFGASLVFLLASYPIGRLADRVGRWKVFILGEALSVGVFVVLASGQSGPLALVVLVVLVGTRYAATDGVLMALASSVLPSSLRATGLGLLIAVFALGRLVASSAYGAVWGAVSGLVAAQVFGVLLALVTIVGAVLLRRRQPPADVAT